MSLFSALGTACDHGRRDRLQVQAARLSRARQVLTANQGAEREAIRSALEATEHHREQAARMLGMSRTTLWRKMKEYGLVG